MVFTDRKTEEVVIVNEKLSREAAETQFVQGKKGQRLTITQTISILVTGIVIVKENL